MIFKRTLNKIRSATIKLHLWLMLLPVICAFPFHISAQGFDQHAVSNGAGLVSGGNYSGYASIGQMGTYMFANGTQVATQGIILNEISGDIEFTFELSGVINENEALKSAGLSLKSASSMLGGIPLDNENVFLVLVENGDIFAQTTTDANGFFRFENVPYKNFYFLVKTSEVPAQPVILSFESNIFIKEVEIFAEVGIEGTLQADVEIQPVATCDPDNPDFKFWYQDSDGDGFGNPGFSVGQCSQPTGYVLNDFDCNDTNPDINPNAEDVPGTGIDANCDANYLWYVDADGDGFGISTTVLSTNNSPGIGESEINTDCDDTNPVINPDAEDIPGSGIDANCDGILPCNGVENLIILAPSDPVNISNSINLSATFEGNKPESAVWFWGDNESTAGIVSDGVVTGTHFYKLTGVYTIQLKTTDNCGLIETFAYQYIVIFDPLGDFVTGGGTIFSPAGASVLYPNATGIASFGFVSKYDKKTMLPKGITEFEFNAGDLYFLSTSYEWLVVAGNKAKFKGKGTINGIPGYQFMISAIDGDLKAKGSPDLFRIKIWEETTGEVVYDNEMGAEIDGDPATVIRQGSIVIHSTSNAKNKSAIASNSNLMIENDDFVTTYPNPTTGKVILSIQTNSKSEIQVFIFNSAGQKVQEHIRQNKHLFELDLTGNPVGMYYVNTIIDSQIFTNKIVIQSK